MSPPSRRAHPEQHYVTRVGWLRAAVLGSNDGIVSVASLLVGVAAAGQSRSVILTTAVAGLVAGALSMASGEYVSVSSQRDSERADIERERRELAADPVGEEEELAGIYAARGLSPELAHRVAAELSAGDVLTAHARDELGLEEERMAQPWQAAGASALSFALGAALPSLAALAPSSVRIGLIIAVTLIALSITGYMGARIGGSPPGRATLRVVLWGAVAMGLTAGIGALVGTAV